MRRLYSSETLAIRSLKHLSLRLGFPLDELNKIAANAEKLYYFEEQEKKNGGIRIISKPKPILKKIQSKIHKLLQEIIPPECAHGGIKGRSNVTNAKVHCDNKWLLQLDFRNFYPNISNYQVYNLFLFELECSPDVARLLTRLCTVRGEVPQGGSMSSDIAILVCRNLGRRLEGLAARYNINYTQYIDDLSFSGPQIPLLLRTKIKEIIAQYGVKLNQEKELIRGRHEPQIVTGLTVNRKRPHQHRETKREWRAEEFIFGMSHFKVAEKT